MKRKVVIIILICVLLFVAIITIRGGRDSRVTLSDIRISETDGTVTFTVRNDSDKDVYFEPTYTIQKRSFVIWREIGNKQDYAVPTHYYVCKAGSEADYTFPWPWMYSSVSPGSYRLSVNMGIIILRKRCIQYNVNLL